MRYNWQQEDWPVFTYDLQHADRWLWDFAGRSGRVSGILETLPADLQVETLIEVMVSEAVKTSEIEGEYLSRRDVMSSIKNKMGLYVPELPVHDKRAAGIGRLMAVVRETFAEPMTQEMLFAWHDMVMEGNSTGLKAGAWRTHEESMQVVSGAMGREKVHFEAPPSTLVPGEMDRFLGWFNATGPGGDSEIREGPVRAAIAHLYFETIHPFEDGNGRIGRAIAEKALSQSAVRPVLLSLSATIEADRKAYYTALESAQRSNEITPWVGYFVRTVLQAQAEVEALIDFTLRKARFFDRFEKQLTDRQLKAIRRMWVEGPGGFEGGMNARKYVAIAKVSKATATRDLQDLAQKGALQAEGAGRSTRYQLAM